MAIKKINSTTSASPAASTKKVVFEPLPGASVSESGSSQQKKKLYITLNNKEYRVNSCTLHKGTPDEISFSFINVWDEQHSVQLFNPTVAQIRETQSTYTRVRGFNIVRFGNKLTVYRMRPLEEAELKTAYEK